MNTSTVKKSVAAGALVLAGLGGGAVLFSQGAATAAATSTSTSPTQSGEAPTGTPPRGAPADGKGHAGEKPLTGTTASKVKAAALAKYPGATLDRLETDSDGVYEAHVTTKSGTKLIVQVGKDFTVTGTQQGPGGDRDGKAQTAPGGSSAESGSGQAS